MKDRLTSADLARIQKLLKMSLQDITEEKLQDLKKSARKKYHPDNFASYDDAVVQELAKERFQEIEELTAKIDLFLQSGQQLSDLQDNPQFEGYQEEAVYGTEGIQIEIMTREKTLKYQLFNRRVIYAGDSGIIPETNARLIALESHAGNVTMGFRDNIKTKLIFGPEDSVLQIVSWLFRRINGKTSSFVIEGKVVKVDPYEILKAIRKETLMELKG
ncbi:MAG: hypothetical protein AAFR61_29230 [Bacteroidota bacterium]